MGFKNLKLIVAAITALSFSDKFRLLLFFETMCVQTVTVVRNMLANKEFILMLIFSVHCIFYMISVKKEFILYFKSCGKNRWMFLQKMSLFISPNWISTCMAVFRMIV
jgi:hypothetical protein